MNGFEQGSPPTPDSRPVAQTWTRTLRVPTRVVKFLVFFIVVLGAAVLFIKGIEPSLHQPNGDFTNYYTASRLLKDGISSEEGYLSFPWFQRRIDGLQINDQVGGLTPYSPATAFVLLPLSGLDPLSAKRVWTFLNVCLLGLNIYLIRKITNLRWLICTVFLLGAGYGLLNNFLWGQIYLLLQSAILATIRLVQTGWGLTAGVVLGIVTPINVVGAAFTLFFAWQRHWKVVVAASLTACSFALASTFLDQAAVVTYVANVLPRHLAGEIQDPFALASQSINSLFRQLFLYEPDLNRDPWCHSPLLFSVSKNLLISTLAMASILALGASRLIPNESRFIFRVALVPIVILMLSPVGASGQFLLLTISAVLLFKIQSDQGRPWHALVLAVIYLATNLPHYVKLMPFAEGGWVTIAYTRLWGLLLFFGFTLFAFRAWLAPTRDQIRIAAVVCLAWLGFSILNDLVHLNRFGETWSRLEIKSAQFETHLGLILDSLDLGSKRIVFTYCEIRENRYRIYTGERSIVSSVVSRWLTARSNPTNQMSSPAEKTILWPSAEKSRSEIREVVL